MSICQLLDWIYWNNDVNEIRIIEFPLQMSQVVFLTTKLGDSRKTHVGGGDGVGV